ncbi:MAG: putative membrane protein YedE/YeeE [Cyclobacteriaceae bacterium]|jgi:uncharacterized membrane protein YedE/YeeE
MDWISASWPWYVGGPMIALVMFLMMYLGHRFGVSSTMETMCTMAGAGKVSDYFKVDWSKNMWNIIFVGGAVIGGFIASEFMSVDTGIQLSEATIANLASKGFDQPGSTFMPAIFTWDNLLTAQGLIFMVLGGFLVGFGTRYAGGCTSGHAISGLSNLQLPSLLATIGFFIGGLIVTHLLLPILL